MTSERNKNNSGKSDPDLYFGSGEFTLPNGDTYQGEYCAHRSGVIWRQGHGVYKTQDGQSYEGEWNDDKLIENSEIHICYPNGVRYTGQIAKNKYNGPGTYTLGPNMNISCEFSNNKPTGDIRLIDCDGKLWCGAAKENSAILLPENIFYLNLMEDRGKGLSKAPIPDLHNFSSSSSSCQEQVKLSDGEWEKIIFANSTLTKNDIDFTDCKWWRDFEQFKQKHAEVKLKMENGIDLDENDCLWIEKFKKYKLRKEKQAERKRKTRMKEKKIVSDLNEKFKSKEFAESCPPIQVFYPRKTWDFVEESSEFDYPSVINSSTYTMDSTNLIMLKADSKLEISSIVSVDKIKNDVPQVSSTPNDDQTVQFNDLVQCSNRQLRLSGNYSDRNSTHSTAGLVDDFELENTEMHFTPFREQMLLENRYMMKQEETNSEEIQARLKSDDQVRSRRQESEENWTKSEKNYDSKDMKSIKSGNRLTGNVDEIKNASVSTRQSQPASVDKKTKLETRIKECVAQFWSERKEKVSQVSKKIAPVKPTTVHTHNTAADTESITGIPRNLLLQNKIDIV